MVSESRLNLTALKFKESKMAIHFAADINADQGTALGWTFENGTLFESISYMLKEIFPEYLHMLKVDDVHRYAPEVHVQKKIEFHDSIANDFFLFYFPIKETSGQDPYVDENGANCRASSKDIDLEVPLYELREAVRQEFPQVVDVDKFIVKALEIHGDDTYLMNHYYGDSVTYAYIKIKKDADLARYL